MFLCTCTHTQNCETCVCVCVCHHPTFPNVNYAVIQPLFVLKKKIFLCWAPAVEGWWLWMWIQSLLLRVIHTRVFLGFFCSARAEKHTSDPWSAIKASTRHLSQQRSDCWAEATASKDVLSFSSPMTRRKKKKLLTITKILCGWMNELISAPWWTSSGSISWFLFSGLSHISSGAKQDQCELLRVRVCVCVIWILLNKHKTVRFYCD